MRNPNRFHYFCQTFFKGNGYSFYTELQCLKVADNNPRLQDYYTYYYTRGLNCVIDNPNDKEHEEHHIWNMYRWQKCSPSKIVFLSEDDVKLEKGNDKMQ
jgi:hypothetical protein